MPGPNQFPYFKQIGSGATQAAAGSHVHSFKDLLDAAVGATNGLALVADNTQVGGVKWAAPTPATHSHPESDVTNLVTDLAGKSAVGHTHVENDVTDLVTAWSAYTPAWTAATTNPTNFTAVGRYKQVGKTVILQIYITCSASFTAGTGNYAVSLPANSANQAQVQVGAAFINAATGNRTGNCTVAANASTLQVFTTASTSVPWSPANPTLASGDKISISISYEAA